jgi:thiol-disulfide isomerase/thioredoxin
MTIDTPSPDTTKDASAPQWSAARRRWLVGAVAGAATLAGVGLARWRANPDSKSAAEPLALWDMVFPTPEGATVAMRTFAGKPLLLNFWATWCPPCVEEMPLLDRFFRENRANDWQVLGMAVDQAPAVSRFLTQRPVGFPITLAGMSGVELSRSLGNQGGGLPFTVVIDRDGLIAQRKMGQVSPQDLQQWRTMHS